MLESENVHKELIHLTGESLSFQNVFVSHMLPTCSESDLYL